MRPAGTVQMLVCYSFCSKFMIAQSLFGPKKGTMPHETHVQILSINVLVLGIARASSFESRLPKMVCPVLSHEGS